MSLKPSVWFGLIVCPAHQVTHGQNRRWLDSGNRFMTEARSGIGTGHTRFFSENQTTHLDSSVTRRSQADNEGMHEPRNAKEVPRCIVVLGDQGAEPSHYLATIVTAS